MAQRQKIGARDDDQAPGIRFDWVVVALERGALHETCEASGPKTFTLPEMGYDVPRMESRQ